MSTKDSLNKLVENITGEEVKTQRITESLTELVKALDAGGYLKPTDDTISEIVDVLAEVLPEKIGGGGDDTAFVIYTNYWGSDGESFGNGNYRANKVAKLILPANSPATKIENGGFSDMSLLEDITIPDTVTSIGDNAFTGCSSLTNITIPDSVLSMGEYVFSGCSSLTNITLPVELPSISAGMFANCESLTNITIPDTVTSIGESAFEGCTALESMVINNNLNSIGNNAIIGNYESNLTYIYFKGSEEEWNAINIGYGNTAITNATIVFNYTP